MTLSADSSFLFDEEVTNKWNKAYNLLGIDPSKLSQYSGKENCQMANKSPREDGSYI